MKHGSPNAPVPAKVTNDHSSPEIVGKSTMVTKRPRHQPNWVVWCGRPTVSLFSAICLIHNITPGRKYLAKLKELADPRCQHFDGHLITLKKSQPLDDRLRSVPPSDAKPGDRTEVSLHGFIDFVRDRMPFAGVSIPDVFWKLTPPRLSLPPHPRPADDLIHVVLPTVPPPGMPSPDQVPLARPAVPERPVEKAMAQAPTSKPVKQRTPQATRSAGGGASRTVNLEQPGFLSLHDVLAIFPVSRSAWYAGIKNGIYPKAVSMGGLRKVGWRTTEIKKLIDNLPRKREADFEVAPSSVIEGGV